MVVLVLSTYAADDDVYRAIQAGASGYLLKDMPLKTLRGSDSRGVRGPKLFSAGNFRSPGRTPAPIRADGPRIIVLQKIAKGMSNKEIGNELGITEGTVKAHVTNILSKLHAADRTQAVTTAIKRGIIHIE